MMQTGLKEIFNEPGLLAAPVKRAAYSDRTSWLMAAMSELAYFRFEEVDAIEELVEDISGAHSANAIRTKVKLFLKNMNKDQGDHRTILADILTAINFELLNTYNCGGTQGFIARRQSEDHPMLVLAFRGTEAGFDHIDEAIKDIKADLRVNLINFEGDEKIHKGFYDAFKLVEDEVKADLEKYSKEPLYITEHSLGGALAVVATRFLGSDSHGACYTFGGPRIGNQHLANKIKTPIYRLVNSTDIVPRMPPEFLIRGGAALLRWIPLPYCSDLANFLQENLRGYVHHGDMRYLTHVAAGTNNDFADIRLISNPSIFERLGKWIPRMFHTWGKAAASDHSISLYRRKLRAYALKRN